MRPYIEKEESDLTQSILEELESDFTAPEDSCVRTEDVSILNSSLLLFSKIKHLLKRASSISKSETLYQVSLSIQRAISKYLEKLTSFLMNFKAIRSQNQSKNNLFNVLNLKNFTNKSKDSSVASIRKEIAEISIVLNTSDYIKETISSVTDLLQSLLNAPFDERVDFTPIEKMCMKVINNAVVGLKSYFLASYPGFGDYSTKKVEFNERIRLLAEDLRGVVGSVYLGKVLSNVCREIVSDW